MGHADQPLRQLHAQVRAADAADHRREMNDHVGLLVREQALNAVRRAQVIIFRARREDMRAAARAQLLAHHRAEKARAARHHHAPLFPEIAHG